MALEQVSADFLRRYIGRQLTRLRENARTAEGKHPTQAQAAQAFGVGRSTMIRMEEGVDGVKFPEPNVKALLDYYGASATDRDLILSLTAETRERRNGRAWWHDYTEPSLPTWFSQYVMLEDSAVSIRQYESELVPGLLQIQEYAEILARTPAGYVSEERVSDLVRVRMDRQALLDRDDEKAPPPRLEVIIGEAAIRRPFADPEIIGRQLQHLLDAGARRRISVRILPATVGVHGGMVSNPFSLLEFPAGKNGEPMEQPLAYMDTLTGSLYMSKPEEVAAYELVWRDLKKNALNTTESQELIRSAMMEGLSR